MNEKTLPYSLSYSEAIAMDELFNKNQSFKKQIEVLISLDVKIKNNQDTDQIVYYVNTLVSELFDSEDFKTIDKYLKNIQKQNLIHVSILFLKVIFCIKLKLDYYKSFQEYVKLECVKNQIEYELVLQDFI